MAPHVGRYEHASLRHRFQRLERRHNFGKPHAPTRIREDIDQLVVSLDPVVRNAAGKNHATCEIRSRGEFPERSFLRTTSDEQHAQIGVARREQCRRFEQQIEALVRIERSREAEHGLSIEAELRSKLGVGLGAELEFADVDRIGDHRNLARGDTAGFDFGLETAADRRDVIGTAERKSFQRPRSAIAEAALGCRPMIDRRILPERAELVDDGDAEAASDAQCRQCIQHR